MKTTAVGTTNTVRVLLVEDEPIVMLTQTSELDKRGFSVVPASTGEDAVAVVAEDPSIDLVLMDIDLGEGINGVQAAAQILERRQLPIVFLTAHAEPEVVEQVKTVTRYGYVLKSSGIFVLTQAISMALELHEQKNSLVGANRAFSSLSELNRRLLEAPPDATEFGLLRELCTALVSEGGYSRAFVIVPEGPAQDVAVLVSAGADPWDPPECLARCVSAGEMEICSGSGQADAGREGGTAAFVPLLEDETVWGCLALDDHGTGFGSEERFVLEELGRSVSIGFSVIRTRRERSAALRAAEERSRQLEEQLRKNRCLFGVSEVLAQSRGDLAAALREAVQLLPGAFRYPDSAEARISCGDIEETTPGFRRTDRILRVTEPPEGGVTIDVTYREPQPTAENEPFTASESELITLVARQIQEFRSVWESERAYKSARAELDETNARLDQALWGSQAGVWEWHIPSGRVIVNERWAEMLGYSLEEFPEITMATWESLCHSEDMERARSVLDSHFRHEIDHYHAELRARHKVGDWIWILDQGAVIEWSAEGAPLRMAGTHIDITSIKREQEKLSRQRTNVETLLAEKDMLLHEVHHRVKNDLALVRSLFSLQASTASNRETKTALGEAGQRISAIAEIYDLIRLNNEAKTVNLDPIVRSIVEKNQLGKSAGTVDVSIAIDHIQVSVRFAMSIGLIVNELVTNSFKYGHSEDGTVRIDVTARRDDDGDIEIGVRDHGPGFLDEGESDPAPNSGFGRLVVESLVDQYDGSISRHNRDGAQVVLRFPGGSVGV